MKYLLISLLLLVSGCAASIKGGELSNYVSDWKTNHGTKITVTPEGVQIETSMDKAATTQRSTSVQPSITGPADALKNIKVSGGDFDTLSGISATFQKPAVQSWGFALLLLGGGIICWLVGQRLLAVGLAGASVLCFLYPAVMLWVSLAAVLGVAVLMYFKYRNANASTTAVAGQHIQVVKSIEDALNKWFTDPAQKADLKTYMAAGQDAATQATIAQIMKSPDVTPENLAGRL